MKLVDVVFAAIWSNIAGSQASAPEQPCESSCASLSLPDSTVAVAQTVAAGALLGLPTATSNAGPHGGWPLAAEVFQSFAGSLELRSPPKTPKSSSKS